MIGGDSERVALGLVLAGAFSCDFGSVFFGWIADLGLPDSDRNGCADSGRSQKRQRAPLRRLAHTLREVKVAPLCAASLTSAAVESPNLMRSVKFCVRCHMPRWSEAKPRFRR
jgi:hypothetical protein